MEEIEECKKLIESLRQKNNELENTLKSYEERLNYLETQHIEDALTRSDTALKIASKNKRNMRHILAFVFLSLTLTMSLVYSSESDRRIFFAKNLELISAILFGAGGIATVLDPTGRQED